VAKVGTSNPHRTISLEGCSAQVKIKKSMTYCVVLRKAASDRNIFVKTSLENGKFGAGKQRLHWKIGNLVLVNKDFTGKWEIWCW
jgi:hypothetical protein